MKKYTAVIYDSFTDSVHAVNVHAWTRYGAVKKVFQVMGDVDIIDIFRNLFRG